MAEKLSTAPSEGEPRTSEPRTMEISRSMVGLVREYTGRGPTKARTTISRDTVVIVLEDALTKGERKLVESGESEHVLQTRRKVQRMMRDEPAQWSRRSWVRG